MLCPVRKTLMVLPYSASPVVQSNAGDPRIIFDIAGHLFKKMLERGGRNDKVSVTTCLADLACCNPRIGCTVENGVGYG